MVKIILENEEVDVNIEDDYGYTALCYAALKGNNWVIHKWRRQIFGDFFDIPPVLYTVAL